MTNMFVFEDVAARKLTPEQAAERLVRERQPQPSRPRWMPRLLFALAVGLLSMIVPSAVDRRS
jgi:hypothetical protein